MYYILISIENIDLQETSRYRNSHVNRGRKITHHYHYNFLSKIPNYMFCLQLRVMVSNVSKNCFRL
jgi:hypothetical protein